MCGLVGLLFQALKYIYAFLVKLNTVFIPSCNELFRTNNVFSATKKVGIFDANDYFTITNIVSNLIRKYTFYVQTY